MEKIIKYLEQNHKNPIYITEQGCKYLNSVQEMITRERLIVREERNILIPGCEIYFLKDDSINAFSTIIDGQYYIFINKGVVEEQKVYLKALNWSYLSEQDKNAYIDELIWYSFNFIVFHEYAHIICGHNDAGLEDPEDKQAQEYEADMFAMDYLINYIFAYNKMTKWTEEIEKMFLSVYFLFNKMRQYHIWTEEYNDGLLQNYYDSDRVKKRNHPLEAQRILYLFEMLTIICVDENSLILPIKENIIKKIKMIKKLEDKNIQNRNIEYSTVNESLQKLKGQLMHIRQKIPRLSKMESDHWNKI